MVNLNARVVRFRRDPVLARPHPVLPPQEPPPAPCGSQPTAPPAAQAPRPPAPRYSRRPTRLPLSHQALRTKVKAEDRVLPWVPDPVAPVTVGSRGLARRPGMGNRLRNLEGPDLEWMDLARAWAVRVLVQVDGHPSPHGQEALAKLREKHPQQRPGLPRSGQPPMMPGRPAWVVRWSR